jgi:hypothetical protein
MYSGDVAGATAGDACTVVVAGVTAGAAYVAVLAGDEIEGAGFKIEGDTPGEAS